MKPKSKKKTAGTVRKNVTMPDAVRKMLEEQAARHHTTASALLTRYIVDAEELYEQGKQRNRDDDSGTGTERKQG